MGSKIRLFVPIVLLAGLGLSAVAQDPAPADPAFVKVKLTVIKATGKVAEGLKPAIPPDLEDVKSLLAKLEYDRYQYLMAPESTGEAKAPFRFKKLPQGLAAKIVWQDHGRPGGDLRVGVTVDRSAKAPKTERVVVAKVEARLKSGATFLLKVPKAYADGDLLLLVSATRVER